MPLDHSLVVLSPTMEILHLNGFFRLFRMFFSVAEMMMMSFFPVASVISVLYSEK